MNAPQIIRTPAGEELVVLPKAEYDVLVAAAEDAEEDAADIAVYDQRKAALRASAEAILPAEVSKFIHEGDSLLKALRKYRGENQVVVANLAGISQSYLSALEAGTRPLTEDVADRLVKVLGIPRIWLAVSP